VFDGHGGQEVAKFAKANYPTLLRDQKLFTDKEDI
jgi:serine/threonine protein phosphatase PrpC